MISFFSKITSALKIYQVVVATKVLGLRPGTHLVTKDGDTKTCCTKARLSFE